ncbi:hypothetical protein RYX36_001627, partial [Vicia faba]
MTYCDKGLFWVCLVCAWLGSVMAEIDPGSQISSRGNQGKRSYYAASSSSQSRQSAEARHLEFDKTRFIGPRWQDRFYSLAECQIWPEMIFTLNPQGDYRYFMNDMERRKWGVLLTPPTKINFEIIREFYANAIPIKYVHYSYFSFVQGRAVSFDMNSVSHYLNNPLNLQRVISNEIRKIAISGHSLCSKAPVTLGFSALITGMCKKVGVDIPIAATKKIISIVNDNYVLKNCVPKLA